MLGFIELLNCNQEMLYDIAKASGTDLRPLSIAGAGAACAELHWNAELLGTTHVLKYSYDIAKALGH